MGCRLRDDRHRRFDARRGTWLGWGDYGDDEMAAAHPNLDAKLGLRPSRRAAQRDDQTDSDDDRRRRCPASPRCHLRLHLSHRLAAPNTLNLDGIFGILNTAVWTDLGPVAVDEVAAVRMRLQRDGHLLHVHGVDKFRAWSTTSSHQASASPTPRVRLGAHLAEGTW